MPEQLMLYLPWSDFGFELGFRNGGRLGYWDGSTVLSIRAVHNCSSTRQRILQKYPCWGKGKVRQETRDNTGYEANAGDMLSPVCEVVKYWLRIEEREMKIPLFRPNRSCFSK